jgi:hypothetical protein
MATIIANPFFESLPGWVWAILLIGGAIAFFIDRLRDRPP